MVHVDLLLVNLLVVVFLVVVRGCSSLFLSPSRQGAWALRARARRAPGLRPKRLHEKNADNGKIFLQTLPYRSFHVILHYLIVQITALIVHNVGIRRYLY